MEINEIDVVKLYKTGINIQQVANAFKCGKRRIRGILNRNGGTRNGSEIMAIRLQRTTYEERKLLSQKGADKRKTKIDPNLIIPFFNEGESVKQIAIRLNIARSVVNRILRENGINHRNGSESMYVRMAQTDIEERKRLTKKANQVVRELPAEFFVKSHTKGSISKQKSGIKIGKWEKECTDSLREVGLNPIPQCHFRTYNIDIACGNIAIEIHRSTSMPHNHPFYSKRIINLLKGGWNVIYVKFTGDNIQNITFDKIVELCKFTGFNPSDSCQYGMINGAGKLLATRSIDGDNLADVPVSESMFYDFFIDAG